jgi:DNA-binding CsgD family transcriptional regulator
LFLEEGWRVLEADPTERSRVGPARGLTRREREVLTHVESGLTNLEIARRMRIARPTVGRLLSNAMDRLGAESRVHAVILAGSAGTFEATRRDERRACVRGEHGARDAREVGPDARALISRIAAGDTVGQAAHALHLSPRTADRRLAQARRAFGVDRTVVAIAWAHRLGWLD